MKYLILFIVIVVAILFATEIIRTHDESVALDAQNKALDRATQRLKEQTEFYRRLSGTDRFDEATPDQIRAMKPFQRSEYYRRLDEFRKQTATELIEKQIDAAKEGVRQGK